VTVEQINQAIISTLAASATFNDVVDALRAVSAAQA
jgi:hypothetical protein